MGDETEARRTVWILGSGFSKPLGGPLLVDLFRQEHENDLEATFPQERFQMLAQDLRWVQRYFNKGLQDGLWTNAEAFLAFVDDAYSGDERKRQLVANLVHRSRFEPGPYTSKPTRESNPRREDMLRDFPKIVRRALAAECSRFLFGADPASELWLPYRRWLEALQPERDVVITFNYDRVIETVTEHLRMEGAIWVPLPGSHTFPGKVPILKVHGSVDWFLSEGRTVKRHPNPLAPVQDPTHQTAIATPGGAKARFVAAHLQPLWDRAEAALHEAERVVVVGYSAPETDPFAQYRVLEALRRERRDVPYRRVHIVLGPSWGTFAASRLLALMESSAGTRTLSPMGQECGAAPFLLYHQHPLYAQDFIGRFEAHLQRPGW